MRAYTLKPDQFPEATFVIKSSLPPIAKAVVNFRRMNLLANSRCVAVLDRCG